jgi:hypothetical protein
MAMSPGKGSSRRSAVDLDALLADAHQAVVARIESDRRPPPAPPKAPIHGGWLAACLGAWGLVLVLFLTPPAVLRGSPPLPYTPPSGLEEASLRWGLWLAHGRVESHREEATRLPTRLGETGFDDPAIELVVIDRTRFRLVGRLGPLQVVLDDREDSERFLGTALEELQAAP